MPVCNLARTRSALLAILSLGLLHNAASASDDDPRRPAAIVTEGVPPVSATLWDRLRQYENIREAAFRGWSPDGKGILIRTRFGNSAQLHRVYEPGGRREQITFFDEPAGGTFIPKSSDASALVTMSRGGNENDQVYLLDQAEHEVRLLTDGASRNLLGPIMHDGSKMIIQSNKRNGRDTDIYVADPRRPDSMVLLFDVDNEHWGASDWSRDGTRVLMNRFVSVNESYPAILDAATRRLDRLPLASEAPASYGSLSFCPEGSFVYLTCDARGEFSQLARLEVQTGKYEWLTADIAADVEDLEVDPATGHVAFTVNQDGASRLFILQAGKRREVKLPLGVVGSLEFSPDGTQLGFTLVRSAAPADAYSIDVKQARLTQWTFSEAGGLDPEEFVEPRRIQFRSFDGRQIPAYYYRPAAASPDKPVPVVIDIHGGPEGQHRPYFSGVTQFYVGQLGVAVISPNVRGSSGYGKTYLKLDNAELREDSVKDIGALLDWIAGQPELDASRVAVSGGSYGGYMVLASLMHYPERIRAGIDIVGIANFITFLERTAPYRQDLRRVEYGDERDPKMRAIFDQINPTAQAEKIESALLVAHGKNDPRVPFSEAQQIADKVRAHGRPVWTVYAENEGHGFAKKDNRDYLAAVMAMFLIEHLKLDAKE